MPLLGSSLWGTLADATGGHQRLFRLTILAVMVLSIVLSLAMQFWTLLAVFILFALLGAPVMPLMDNSVLA
jgi:hypothetical protein